MMGEEVQIKKIRKERKPNDRSLVVTNRNRNRNVKNGISQHKYYEEMESYSSQNKP